ncbi:MAG: hypothetical protein QUU85_05075 [Candidatus Eisenbacteria bacterium]|nr:hypothetical protein [Candidatus Eisenbacteria bacterium]
MSESYGRIACLQRLVPLILRTNEHTYLSTPERDDPLGATWLELGLRGLENLHERFRPKVRRAAVIGTGSGLDAIGIAEIFSPESIVASDIHPRALEAARWNVAGYLRPEVRCELLRSDLFRGYSSDTTFDLVFENLPNVPEDEATGASLLEGIRSSSCYNASAYVADPLVDRHLLTLHYNCLLEARDHLTPDGWVVSLIGGRIPWAVVVETFRKAGFGARVLEFGIKTQTEPGIVLEGYARAEEDGSPPFLYYYPPESCLNALPRGRDGRGDGADPAGTVEEGNAALDAFRVSAREALALHRRGKKVCHTVYVVGGHALGGRVAGGTPAARATQAPPAQ